MPSTIDLPTTSAADVPLVAAEAAAAEPRRGNGTSRLLIFLSRGRINVAMFLAPATVLLARPTVASIATWLPLLIGGIAFRCWARGHLERAAQVTWNGPYAIVRHPLYVGSFAMGAAMALMTRLAWVPPLFVLMFVAMYWPKVVREEAWMRQRFGTDYERYASQVRAVLPGWPVRLDLPNPTHFTWARVRRHREWKTWVGAFALVGVLALRVHG